MNGEAATTCGTALILLVTSLAFSIPLPNFITSMCEVVPSIFALRSSWNPAITDRTMTRAITPTITPAMDMKVMMDMNVCFLFAFRYLRPIKSS